MVFTGTLTNYEDICSLYGCDRLINSQDPATLLLQLYMQVGTWPMCNAGITFSLSVFSCDFNRTMDLIMP